MTLTPDEARRYSRHIILKGFGGTGQTALKAAHVVVVGAGGLGAPVIAYLAAAGVGHLSIIDPDAVALHNLQRQIIHTTDSVGEDKSGSAARFVAALNPEVKVTAHTGRLDAETAGTLLAGVDVVVEGTDSFAARQAIATACEALAVPLVSGAVTMFDGQVTVLAPHLRDAEGRSAPRLSDLYAVAPQPGEIPACEDTGVLATLTGTIGTMMATEVLKLLTGFAPPLIGRLLIHSARSGETHLLRYGRREG